MAVHFKTSQGAGGKGTSRGSGPSGLKNGFVGNDLCERISQRESGTKTEHNEVLR